MVNKYSNKAYIAKQSYYNLEIVTTRFIVETHPWFVHMWPWTTKPVIRSIFWNWDLYIIWKLNKYAFHWCMVCLDRTPTLDRIWPRYNYLKIWNLRVQKNLNIEKITFKVVQMNSLAMHITNQKLRFDICTVGNLQNIFMEHDLYLIS